MTEGIPVTDPRFMWQQQPREHSIMDLEEIRTRARQAQVKVRRNLIIAFTMAALLLALGTIVLGGVRSTPVRVVAAAIMALTVAVVYRAYRGIWSSYTLPPNAGLKGCLEFYRNELLDQYRSAALTWRFLVPLAVFGFLTWNALFRTSHLIPRILFTFALGLLSLVRHYEVRKLRRRLTALDEFEK